MAECGCRGAMIHPLTQHGATGCLNGLYLSGASSPQTPSPPNPWQQLLAAASNMLDYISRPEPIVDPMQWDSVDPMQWDSVCVGLKNAVKALEGVEAADCRAYMQQDWMQGEEASTIHVHLGSYEPTQTVFACCRQNPHAAGCKQWAAIPAAMPIAAVETGLSEPQKRLGLRSTRYVNASPYDCDIDD